MSIVKFMASAPQIKCVRLKSGGYKLIEDYHILVDIKPKKPLLISVYLKLDTSGILTIRAGYQWDGSSGPVIDRKANMRAGLVHDALYQLMRAKLLDISYRKQADHIYRELYVQDGGWRLISWLDFAGLTLFAGYAAKPQKEVEEKVLHFP